VVGAIEDITARLPGVRAEVLTGTGGEQHEGGAFPGVAGQYGVDRRAAGEVVLGAGQVLGVECLQSPAERGPVTGADGVLGPGVSIRPGELLEIGR
jgi:hypothetical protein